jgi:hypothetical protein
MEVGDERVLVLELYDEHAEAAVVEGAAVVGGAARLDRRR